MLDISPALVIIAAVIFLVTLVLLNKWLYQPLIAHMDDRKASIDRDLKSANSNSANVDELVQEANDIIAKAKSEANSIREDAMNKSKSLWESEVSKKRDGLEAKYSSFITSLDEEKVALRDSLLEESSDYTKAVKDKIVNI